MSKHTPEQFFAALTRNADDVQYDRINWVEFSERNALLWRAIEAAGMEREVLALWRAENPI